MSKRGDFSECHPLPAFPHRPLFWSPSLEQPRRGIAPRPRGWSSSTQDRVNPHCPLHGSFPRAEGGERNRTGFAGSSQQTQRARVWANTHTPLCNTPRPAAEAARRGVHSARQRRELHHSRCRATALRPQMPVPRGLEGQVTRGERALQSGSFHTRKEDIKAILNPLFSHPSERSLNSSFTRSSDVADRTCFPLNCPRE